MMNKVYLYFYLYIFFRMASDRCVFFFLFISIRPVWGMTQMTSFECKLNTFGYVLAFAYTMRG